MLGKHDGRPIPYRTIFNLKKAGLGSEDFSTTLIRRVTNKMEIWAPTNWSMGKRILQKLCSQQHSFKRLSTWKIIKKLIRSGNSGNLSNMLTKKELLVLERDWNLLVSVTMKNIKSSSQKLENNQNHISYITYQN